MQQTTTHPDPTTPSYRRSLRVASSLFVTIAIPLLLVIGAFTLFMDDPVAVADELGPEAPGSIAGVVKDRNGALLAAIEVSLYRQSSYASDDWYMIRTMTTQADGKYRFTVLPIGNYRVGASDPKRMYPPIFYPTAPTVQKAIDLNIAGNQMDGVDLIFYPGGQITGVVTATTSFSLTAGMVAIHQEVKRQGIAYWEVVQSVPLPVGGGVYSFTNLSANSYRICANGVGVTLATYECYDNVYDIQRATPLTITSGASISNVNITLGDDADYGRISGRVTNLNNGPLAGIEVYAIRDNAPPFVQATQSSAVAPAATPVSPLPFPGGWPLYPNYNYPYALTDSQGNYRLANLAEGNYRLLFRDPTGAYAFTYYNNSTLPEGATLLSLEIKQNITGVNVQLAPGGHIHGVVTIAGQPAPIRFLRLQIKTPSGWQYAMDSDNVSIDGQYDIGGLPPGVYRVWTAASITDSYTNYFYQGYYFLPDAADLSEGFPFTAISLAAGEMKTAHIALSGGPQFDGSLSGRVTAAGAPLAGAKVMLYAQNSGCCFDQRLPLVYVLTNAEGRYTINGLTSNFFYVGVADPTGLYATTYYTGHTTPTTATPIAVEDGQARNDINVDLPLAGAISGRVTRPDGRTVPDLLVTVSILDKPFGTFIAIQLPPTDLRTDADGRYTVKGLHPGEYNICLQDTQRGFTKCHGMLQGVFDPTAGRISVRAGATTTNIDVRWGPDLKNYLPIIAR